MNLNYLLNKHYYATFEHSHFKHCNQELTQSKFAPGGEVVSETIYSFALKTGYPGLLFGLGTAHAAGKKIAGDEKEGPEIKLGFTLDYVTGLPIIPGSTVKGVLLSAFKKYPDAIADDLLVAQKSIFGTPDEYGKCVFYDAIPVAAGGDNRLFGLDNITPHSDPLKNPIPLTMLKVIPGVTYLFRFDLKQCEHADRVKNLFREILINLGIGAKTNVGFGVMVAAPEQSEYKMLTQTKTAQNGVTPEPSPAPLKPPGVCQHPDCDAKTMPKPQGGGFQPLCQPHYLESLKKKGSRSV